jgi:6-phosphofructokinase 2
VLDKLATLPERPKFVVASGSVPPGVPVDFFARVARLSKQLGAQSLIDTSGPALKAALGEGVTLIKPNLVELSDLIGAKLASDDACIDACRKLIKEGRVEIVALTLGEQGALLVTADSAYRTQPLAIEPVSTVGAGDSFLGGLVAARAAGQPLQEAFRVAVAAGSAAVLQAGTELCREEDVKRLQAEVKVRTIAFASA